MPSILTIEDGTGVEDANSYAAAAAARDYAAKRGIALADAPESGNDPVEQWLILAAQYLEGRLFIGCRATTAQALEWPRILRRPFRGYAADVAVLPRQIIQAQCQLVIEQFNGIELQPSTPGGPDGQFITREKVDVIETNYSEKLGTLSTPTMPVVDVTLRGLVVSDFLSTERA